MSTGSTARSLGSRNSIPLSWYPQGVPSGKGLILPHKRRNGDPFQRAAGRKALRNTIDATGCRAGEMHCEPYEKRACSRS